MSVSVGTIEARMPQSSTYFPSSSVLSSLTDESSSYVRVLEACEQLTQYAVSLNSCSVVSSIATHDESSRYYSESVMYSSDKLSEECILAISSLSNCMKNHSDKMCQIVACKCLAQFCNLIYGLLYNYNSVFPNIESDIVPECIRTLEDDICINVTSKLCTMGIMEEDDSVAASSYESLNILIFGKYYRNVLEVEVDRLSNNNNNPSNINRMEMEFRYRVLYNIVAPRYLRQLFQRMMLMKSNDRHRCLRLILSCIENCSVTSDSGDANNNKKRLQYYDMDYRSMLNELLYHWILPDMMNGMQRLEYKEKCVLASLQIIIIAGVDGYQWNCYDICLLSCQILSLSLQQQLNQQYNYPTKSNCLTNRTKVEMITACLVITLRGLSSFNHCPIDDDNGNNDNISQDAGYWNDSFLLAVSGLYFITPSRLNTEDNSYQIGILTDMYLLLFCITTLNNQWFIESMMEEMISYVFETDNNDNDSKYNCLGVDMVMTLCTSSYLLLNSTCNLSTTSSSPTSLDLQSTMIWIRLSIIILKLTSFCLTWNNDDDNNHSASESYFILLLTTLSLVGYTSSNSFSFQLLTQMTSSSSLIQHTILHRCKDLFVDTITHHQQQLQQQLHQHTQLSTFIDALIPSKSKNDLFLLLSQILQYYNKHRYEEVISPSTRIGILAILAEYWIIQKKLQSQTLTDDHEINARDVLSLLGTEISIILKQSNQDHMDLLLICIHSIEKMALSSLERQLLLSNNHHENVDSDDDDKDEDECTYIVSVSFAALSGYNAITTNPNTTANTASSTLSINNSHTQKLMQQECSKAVTRIQYMIHNRKKLPVLSSSFSKTYYNSTKTIHIDYTPYLKSTTTIDATTSFLSKKLMQYQTSFFHIQSLVQQTASHSNFHPYLQQQKQNPSPTTNPSHKYAPLHSDYPLNISPFTVSRNFSSTSLKDHCHDDSFNLLGSSDPLQVSMGYIRKHNHLYLQIKIYNITPVSIPNGLRVDLYSHYVPITTSHDSNTTPTQHILLIEDDCSQLYQSLYNHEISSYECINWSLNLPSYNPMSSSLYSLQRQIHLRITFPNIKDEPPSHTLTWAVCPLLPKIIQGQPNAQSEPDLSTEDPDDDSSQSDDSDGHIDDDFTSCITLSCDPVIIPSIVMLSPCSLIFHNNKKKGDELLFCLLWSSYSANKMILPLVKQQQQNHNNNSNDHNIQNMPVFIRKSKFKFSNATTENNIDRSTSESTTVVCAWAFQSWKNKRLFCVLFQLQKNAASKNKHILEIRSDDSDLLLCFNGNVSCQKCFVCSLLLDDYVLFE